VISTEAADIERSTMVKNISHTERRKFLKLLGAGSIASVAGCVGLPGGGGNGGNGGGQGFLDAAKQLGFATNLRDRRLATTEEWPIGKRKDVPPRNADGWQGSGSFESAPWKPPEGWKDTPAGEIDQLEILNHGSVNMKFDPATLATHQIFEAKTGIKLKPVEIGVDQANQQEQQTFRAKQKTPHLMNVTAALVPIFVRRGYLTPVDSLYPTQRAWDMYIPALQSLTQWDTDQTRQGTHAYGFPNIAEASVGSLRTDLVKEQGIDPKRFQGEWSWDLLEETMKAFKGTGTFGFAYYAGTPTYLSYSFRDLLYEQGGRLVQKDGTVKFDTPAAITVVEKMAEWYQKGWVPGDVVTYGEGDIVDLFLSGQIAFATGFTDFIPQALSKYKAGSEYLAVLPPKATTGPKPSQSPLVDPNATAINTFADTKHKLAALLYGDLRLSYTSQWWEFTYEGNMSFLDAVYDDAGKYNFVRFSDVLGSAIENGVVEVFPRMQEVFTRMTTPVQQAIQGKKSPKAAMQDLQNWIDENVNKDKKQN
jgi:multiple sugar transport system substrate-binding protein